MVKASTLTLEPNLLAVLEISMESPGIGRRYKFMSELGPGIPSLEY